MSGLSISETRDVPGAISLRTSSHFAPMENSKFVKPVMFPPGRARVVTTRWQRDQGSTQIQWAECALIDGGLQPQASREQQLNPVAAPRDLLRRPLLARD